MNKIGMEELSRLVINKHPHDRISGHFLRESPIFVNPKNM